VYQEHRAERRFHGVRRVRFHRLKITGSQRAPLIQDGEFGFALQAVNRDRPWRGVLG